MAEDSYRPTRFVQFCIQYSSVALLYYDYILTFPLELEYIWRKKFTASTVFYLFCRYGLLANLFYLLSMASVIDNCTGWYQFDAYLSIAGLGSVLAIFALRTYVVWDRSIKVGAFMGTLWVIAIAFDFWHATGDKCNETPSPTIAIANTGLSIVVCVFECIGTLLTAVRCLQTLKMHNEEKKGHHSENIFQFMLREGLIYFFGVFGFSLTAVVLNFETPVAQPNSHYNMYFKVFAASETTGTSVTSFLGKLMNAMTTPVSGLLSARLLLYLRQYSDRKVRGTSFGTRTEGLADGIDDLVFNHSQAPTMDDTSNTFTASANTLHQEPEFGSDTVAGLRAVLTREDRHKVMYP